MAPDVSEPQGLEGKAFEGRYKNIFECVYQKAPMELERECMQDPQDAQYLVSLARGNI